MSIVDIHRFAGLNGGVSNILIGINPSLSEKVGVQVPRTRIWPEKLTSLLLR